MIADSCYEAKNYEIAIQYGKKAEENIETHNRLRKIMPTSYVYLGKYDLALKAHIKNVKQGAYLNILDSNKKKLVNIKWDLKAQKARNKYEKKIDYNMRQELYLMIEQDQKYRELIGNTNDSYLIKVYKDSMRRVDKYNQTRLVEMIMENKGRWIYEKVRHNEHDSIWQPNFLILHSPNDEYRLYMLNKLIQAAKRNKSEWSAVFSVMQDIYDRPYYSEDVRLRYIVPKKNGHISEKRSYFGLYTFTSYLTTQRYPMLTVPQMERMSHPMIVENARKRGTWNYDVKIRLYMVKFENESAKEVEKYKKGLLELKEYLVSQGVKSENIEIDNTIHTRVYDKLGKYRYAFQTISSK